MQEKKPKSETLDNWIRWRRIAPARHNRKLAHRPIYAHAADCEMHSGERQQRNEDAGAYLPYKREQSWKQLSKISGIHSGILIGTECRIGYRPALGLLGYC